MPSPVIALDLDGTLVDTAPDLIATLNQEFKKTIVMVTHDPRAATRAHIARVLDKGLLAPHGDDLRHLTESRTR